MDFDELEFNSEEQVSTQPDKADYVLSDEDETPEICEGTEKTESTERTDEICGSEQVTEIIPTEPTPPEAQEVSEFPEGFDEIPDDDLSEEAAEKLIKQIDERNLASRTFFGSFYKNSLPSM